MTITFLGTSAAEGSPPVFSRSPQALRIREREGKDLRTRSSLRLGEHHQIDFSPDNFWQMCRCGTDMYDIEHLLISHTHDDHFQFEQIIAKEMPEGTNGKPLHLYLSNAGKAWLERAVSCTGMLAGASEDKLRHIRDFYLLHGLEHFREYDLGGLRAWTVRGNHHVSASGEESINYLLELPGGACLLYAVDTGYYEPASWEFLQGRRVDILIMESTFGGRRDREEFPGGHLDCRSFVRMLEEMERISFIDEATRIYATHINPDQGLDHAGMQAFFDGTDYAVTVAWDCLSVASDPAGG